MPSGPLKIGVPDCDFSLNPEESVSLPSVLVMRRQNMRIDRAQNIWRKFVFEHKTPKDAVGKPVCAPIYTSIGGNIPTEKLVNIADFARVHELPFSMYGVDAGWYGGAHVPQKKGRFYQSSCPYCGKKVGLFRTWMLKNKGDYFCPECGNRSAVVIDKVIVPMAITAVAISLILVLIFTFLVDMHIWSIILIFIPFLVFFCASVFLVRFKRIAPPGAKRKKKPVQDDMQNTRVI